MAKEHQPARGTFRVFWIELVKHGSHGEEWKGIWVVFLEEVIECRIQVAMGEHGLDNLDGLKSGRREVSWPAVLWDWDFSKQFRGDGCRSPARFLEQLIAYGGWKRPHGV